MVDIDWIQTENRDNLISAFNTLPAEVLTDIMIKAFSLPTPSQVSDFYSPSPKHLQNWDRNTKFRRAIASISNYYNTLGIFRSNFDKNLNDRLAETVYFLLVEKAMQDYICSLDFRVVDKKGEHVETAEDFLRHPNPQDTWSDLIKAGFPDLLRYDAMVWVKTFAAGGWLAELKAYKGTEFWPEIDRDIMHIAYPDMYPIPDQVGYLSRGYIQRWWQRSRTGIYVSFLPEEICYFSMYPQSDDVYGTDYLQFLKYQIQYLIDSTRAAGMTFANGVVPSIVWKHPQVMTPKQMMERVNEVKTANKGANNFGSILHTVRDEEVTTLAHTLHDMEWLEGQQFIGQLVWAMWGFQPSEFVGANVNRACYSDDTEVLTENGWKLHQDIRKDERIAVYDKDTNECRLEVPKSLHTYYAEEDLVRFKTNAQDILVTKEHTILRQSDATNKKSPWIVSKAIDVLDKRIAVKAGVESWKGESEEEISDDYLRFLGWAISEGGLSSSTRKTGRYTMTLAQSNKSPENVQEIKRVLKSLGLKYEGYQNPKDNTTRWNISSKKIIGPLFDLIGAYCTDKKIPRKYLNLPKEKLNCLFEALMAGDGSWDKRPNRICGYYSTTSPQLADDMQELALKLGYGTKRTVHYFAHGNRGTCHRVLIQRKIRREVASPKVEHYSGNVYCFSTSTGFYVTRRNGCVAVQGNTAYIGRNITKSKVLYPIMRFIEEKVNDDILPYLKGYTKYWKFSFIRDIDLDDEIKMAEIAATRANTVAILVGCGVKVPSAMQLAGMGDSVKTLGVEYYTQEELSRIKGATKTDGAMKDDHGDPKKFSQPTGYQKESYTGRARAVQFGDKEERAAGIQKSAGSITITDNDEVEVTFIPAGPSIVTNKGDQSKELGDMIRKDLQEAAHNHRPKMRDPEVYSPVIEKYVKEYNLDVIEHGS